MKTLAELWKESGEKPGLKVRMQKYGGWFKVQLRTPSGDFIGWEDTGRASHVKNGDACDLEEWELYVEPPAEKQNLVLWRLKEASHCPLGAIVAFPANVECNDKYERVNLSDIEGWEK